MCFSFGLFFTKKKKSITQNNGFFWTLTVNCSYNQCNALIVHIFRERNITEKKNKKKS